MSSQLKQQTNQINKLLTTLEEKNKFIMLQEEN